MPRADLVLFVLSADRPLSESELAFLKYIRQWRKKVVFVVNKVGHSMFKLWGAAVVPAFSAAI